MNRSNDQRMRLNKFVVCMIFLMQSLQIQSVDKFNEVLRMFDGGYFSTLKNVNQVQKYGLRPLESAIIHHDEMAVKNLIFQYADVNMKNSKGRASLHQAVERNCSPYILQYLIDHGAKINMKDKFGMTPLQLAQKMSNQDAIEFLTQVHIKSPHTIN